MEYCYNCYRYYKNINQHNKTQKHKNNLRLCNIPEEIHNIVNYYFFEYDLFSKGWDYKFYIDKTSLGECDYNQKIIYLSYFLIFNEDELVDTILHEIAHLVVGSECDHNKIWRDYFISIGGSGKMTGEKSIVNKKEFKYNLICEDGCCHLFNRISKKREKYKNNDNYCYKHNKIIKLIKNY
jgi:predicted SprT family Zn-dependent metalloprotease